MVFHISNSNLHYTRSKRKIKRGFRISVIVKSHTTQKFIVKFSIVIRRSEGKTEKGHLISHILLKMGAKDHRTPYIGRMSIDGMPTSGEGDDGDTRSRRDEQAEHPISICVRGYR